MVATAELMRPVDPLPLALPAVPVDPAVAKRLRALAKQHANVLGERNRLVVEAHEAGASLREIAAELGISHVAVLKIIQREQGGSDV